MLLLAIAAATLMIIVGVAYMVYTVGKFGIIKRLSNGKKLLNYFLSFAVILFVFTVLFLTFTFINALVIFLYVMLFFWLSGGLMRAVSRITGKKFRVHWQGWLALVVSVLFFTTGYVQCMNVWQKYYSLKTEKRIGTLRIAMFADSHIGTTFDGEGFAKHLQVIEQQDPDILLIAGDFVDDWSTKKDMVAACRELGKLKVKYGVWFASGNHDLGKWNDRDFSSEDLKEALEENGIQILEDTCSLIDERFYVAGRLDYSFGKRKNMDELLSGINPEKYVIVLDHWPNDYKNEAVSQADLVLSGHTHGGQLFPLGQMGVLLGINDRFYGHEKRDGTDFIVTSGISDWELFFKTGTRSEYVIIDITEEK